jgi:hypothetical protein
MALLSCILRGLLRCIADYRGGFIIAKIIPHVPREEDALEYSLKLALRL